MNVEEIVAKAAEHAAFWALVDVRHERECWPWKRSVNVKSGYGQFHPERGVTVFAHRVAYENWYGPIPSDRVVDHVRSRGCTRKDCCNPMHLEAVRQGENISRGALGFGDGMCRARLHDITLPGSIEVRANGKRRCVQCRRASARRRHSAGR